MKECLNNERKKWKLISWGSPKKDRRRSHPSSKVDVCLRMKKSREGCHLVVLSFSSVGTGKK